MPKSKRWDADELARARASIQERINIYSGAIKRIIKDLGGEEARLRKVLSGSADTIIQENLRTEARHAKESSFRAEVASRTTTQPPWWRGMKTSEATAILIENRTKDAFSQFGMCLETARAIYRTYPALVMEDSIPEPYASLFVKVLGESLDDNERLGAYEDRPGPDDIFSAKFARAAAADARRFLREAKARSKREPKKRSPKG